MPSAGSVFIDLLLNDAQFRSNIGKSSQYLKNASGQWKRNVVQVNASFDGLFASAKRLAGLFGAGFSIIGLANTADRINLLAARVQQSTQNTEEFQQAFKALSKSAVETGAGLDAAVQVFQRLSFTRNEIHASVAEMTAFTDTVQKLGIVSGASTDSLRFGLTQLGQSLSSGVVRAQEFNSIMENIPAVGKAIADQFGVTTGQLRQLVVQGKVLSEDVFTAILRAQKQADEQFSQLPVTLNRGFASATEGAGIFIGELNRTLNLTNNIGTGLQDIGVFLQQNTEYARAFGNVLQDTYQGMITLFGSFGLAVQGPEKADALKSFLQDRARLGKDLQVNQSAADYQSNYAQVSAQINEALKNNISQQQFKQQYDKLAQGLKSGTGNGSGSDAPDRQKKSIDDLNRLYDKNRTLILGVDSATLQYQDTIADLNKLVDSGRITQTQYDDAVARAQDEFEKSSEKAELWSFDMEAAGKRAAENIQDALADFLFDPADKGFKGMLKSFVDVVRRMQAEAASAQILKYLFGDQNPVGGSGGGLGGIFGNILGSVFGGGGHVSAGGLPLPAPVKPSFAVGIDRVPYDMEAVIHKDEAVLKKSDAEAWRSGAQQGDSYTFNLGAEATSRDLRRLEAMVLALSAPGTTTQRVQDAQARGAL